MMAMPHIVMQAMPHPGGAPVMQVQQIPMQTIQVQQNSMQAVLEVQPPEMQAQPGFFTNERGNLKVRVCPRRRRLRARCRAPASAMRPRRQML
jgi:hypothetical protein